MYGSAGVLPMCAHVNMFVCTQDNGDCVNREVSVPQCSPEATPVRGECQLVKKKNWGKRPRYIDR